MPKVPSMQRRWSAVSNLAGFAVECASKPGVTRLAAGGASVLQSFSMMFDGHLLNRGFWLYVWQIKGPTSNHVYVGRTGDSSSANASSPFKRIGQHLDPKPNAKGNALGKQLLRRGVIYSDCSFEMVAVGPIFPEQTDFETHVPFRNQMAALERAIADELKNRLYDVLGSHPRKGVPDQCLLQQLITLLDPKFPSLVDD